MRKVVLDTETTGLDVSSGHRIIEIGAIELINHVPTEKKFHQYINPQRPIDPGAFEVHGLSEDFLSSFPLFSEIIDKFLEFISTDDLIIHNASFDIGFINSELDRAGHSDISKHRVIDTLAIARKRYPGAQANLNALCRRFEINNSHRNLHGALVDADLLAAVYLELIGGKQPGFKLTKEPGFIGTDGELNWPKENRPIRTFQPSEEELTAHSLLVQEIANPIWKV